MQQKTSGKKLTPREKEKILNSLVDKGAKQGYLLEDEFLSIFTEIEEDIDFLDQIYLTLSEKGVEIINPNEEEEKSVPEISKKQEMTLEKKIKILKAIQANVAHDPIRAYLQEI